MRVGTLLAIVSLSSPTLADPWDPLGPTQTGDSFAPMSTTTRTSDEARNDEPATKRWYGWQTLGVDALSIGLVAAADPAHSSDLATFGALGFLAGAPVIHGLHGHGEKALGSALLRIGLPAAGGVLGYAATADDERWTSGLQGFVIGSLVGVGTAIALDAVVLAWEPRPFEPWRPSLSLRADGAVVGARGSF